MSTKQRKRLSKPVFSFVCCGARKRGQVSKLASSLRTSSPNSPVGSDMAPFVQFRQEQNGLLSCLLTNTQKHSVRSAFVYLLRGPESNRGLEVMLTNYNFSCSSKCLICGLDYTFIFLLRVKMLTV